MQATAQADAPTKERGSGGSCSHAAGCASPSATGTAHYQQHEQYEQQQQQVSRCRWRHARMQASVCACRGTRPCTTVHACIHAVRVPRLRTPPQHLFSCACMQAHPARHGIALQPEVLHAGAAGGVVHQHRRVGGGQRGLPSPQHQWGLKWAS